MNLSVKLPSFHSEYLSRVMRQFISKISETKRRSATEYISEIYITDDDVSVKLLRVRRVKKLPV